MKLLNNRSLVQIAMLFAAERLVEKAVERANEAKILGDAQVEHHWLTTIAGIFALMGVEAEDLPQTKRES